MWPRRTLEERAVDAEYISQIRGLFLVLCTDRREGAIRRFTYNFVIARAARDAAVNIIKEKSMPASKRPIPDIASIVNSDGTLNTDAAMAGVQMWFEQNSAGHCAITDVKAHQNDAGPSNLPGYSKKIHLTVSLTRHE